MSAAANEAMERRLEHLESLVIRLQERFGDLESERRFQTRELERRLDYVRNDLERKVDDLERRVPS